MAFIKNIEHETVLPLAEQVTVQPGQIVSRTLAQNKAVSVTLFAFDKGEEISTHDSTGDAMVQVLEGKGKFTVGGKEHFCCAGDVLIMPAKVPHAVYAEESFKMLARPDAGEEELAQQLKRVRAEKLAVAPGCATCVAKCGNTDDYDMERLWNGPDQVRSLKIRLFSGLKKTGRDAFKVIENGKGKDKHFQSIMESIYKGLFILAEDWEPEEILPAIAELDEAEIMVKEFL